MRKILLLFFMLAGLLTTQQTHAQKQTRETAYFNDIQQRLNRRGIHYAEGKADARGKNARAKKPIRRAASPLMVAGDGTTLYGNIIYASNWTEEYQPCGMYSFQNKANTGFREVAISNMLYASGGGTWVDDKFVFVDYTNLMGMVIAYLEVYDPNTWTEVSSLYVEGNCISTDMTWDPTTGNVYGCFFNDDLDAMVFGRLDLETGVRTKLCDLDRIFMTIAANRKGEVYGIAEDGYMYQFDKQTGAQRLIGHTGLTPLYLSSGCFIPGDDNTLYYAFDGVDAGLYAVDVQNAKATLVNTFPNNEEVVAMYVPIPAAEDGAPAMATITAAGFQGESLNGEVSFVMPTKTFAGAALEGEMDWFLYVNDKQTAAGRAQAGQTVSNTITVEQPGLYKISVRTGNAVGLSPVAKTNVWAGPDQPSEPQNVTLTKKDATRELTLKWEAPTTTQHSGFMPENIRYDVVRMPDSVTVARGISETLFSEVVVEEPYRAYWYNVIVNCEGTIGKPSSALSNKVLMGTALKLPYTNNFDVEEDFDLMTVLDVAGDGRTWGYNSIWQAAYCYFHLEIPKNDWMILPPMNFETNRVYVLDFDARANDVKMPERLKVALGDEPKASRMRTTILPTHTYTNDVMEHTQQVFRVNTAGQYYMGFQACSEADQWWLFVDNISITEGPLIGAPAAVTDLTLTPGRLGTLSATLKFTVPTQTVDGEALKVVNGVKIYRDDLLLTTLPAASAGATLTYTDPMNNLGINTYRVVPYNTIGDGLAVTGSVYCGIDVPTAPTDVVAVETTDGTVRLTWKAPTQGAHNAYLNARKMAYYVLRLNDQQLVANAIGECEFVDKVPEGDGKQQFVNYAVFAATDAGLSEDPGFSNTVCVGNPWQLPFRESFIGHTIEQDPWDYDILTGSSTWGVKTEGGTPSTQAQDADNGFVSFITDYEATRGHLISSKIDLTSAVNPWISFWYNGQVGSGDIINVRVQAKGGELTTVHTLALTDPAELPGWKKASVNISQYIGQQVQIAFEVTSQSGLYDMHLDNITVRDVYDHNMNIAGLKVPESIPAYTTTPVQVTVRNDGAQTESEYTVQLLMNGSVIAEQSGRELTSEEKATFEFSLTPDVTYGKSITLQARVVLSSDQFQADDCSPEIQVEVVQPKLPNVTDLSLSVDNAGNVVLEWGEPDTESMQMELTLMGFNVYRDNVKVTDEPVGDFTWSEPMQSKNSTYTVTAVYEQGESDFSNACLVSDYDAIRGIAADRKEGAVYDIAGRRVKVPTRGVFITNGQKIIKK